MKKIYSALFLIVFSVSFANAQCTTTNATGCQCLGGGTNCDLLPDITIASQPLQASGNNGVIEYSQDPAIAGADAGRLRISVCTPNIGHGPMETRGDTIWVCGTDTFHGPTAPSICPNGTTYPKQLIKQRIYHKNTNGTMTYTDHPAGTMTYHPTHGHQHIDNWGIYTLRTQTTDPNPLNWPIIGNGAKLAFCLLDYGSCNSYSGYCHDSLGTTLSSTNMQNYGLGGGSYGCSNTVQGISAGFVDIYYQYLDGMWIVIPPGVCNGNYYIVVQQDPYNLFVEENENNNILAIPITLTKQGGVTPTITANGPTSFCPGGSVTLTSSLSVNYLWTNGATTQSIVVTNPGSYSVTTGVGSSCSSTSTPVNVTSTSVPVTTSATFTNVCSGGSTTLSATATTSGSTNQQLTFTNNTVYNIPDNNTTGVSSSVTVSGISPTTINSNTTVSAKVNITHPYVGDLKLYLISPGGSQITLCNQRGGSGDNFVNTIFSPSAANSITTGAAPFTGSFLPEQAFSTLTGNSNGTWTFKVVDAAANDIGTINNWILTLNNVVPSTPSYAWTSSPAGFTSSLQNPSVNPTVTTTYTCVVTDPATGCTGTSSVTITVNTPTVSINTPSAICQGQSTTLTASGATTYSWSPSTGLSATTGASVIASPASTTTYTVTGTTSGCTATNTVTVTVNPNPVVSLSGVTTICAGNSTTLSASGATTYFWAPPIGLSSQTGSSVTANPTSTQTYTVVGTTNGCTDTKQITVTVNPLPVVNIGGNTSVCAGQSANLTATGALNYQWTGGPSIASYNVTPTISTTYTVTGTNANGCSSTASQLVTVNPLPVVSFSGLANSYQVTASTVTLTGSPLGGTFSGTGISGNTFNAASAGVGGPYTITYSYTNANGCSNSSSQQTSVINCSVPAMPGTIGGTNGSKVCPGDTRTYKVTAVTGITFNWTPPTGGVIQTGQGTNQITILYNAGFTANGTLSVTANNGCGASAPRTLAVNRNIPTTPSVISGLINGVCNLTNQSYSVTTVANVSYNWSFTAATAVVAGGQGTSVITANYNAGFVSATLKVTANNACGASPVRSATIKAAPASPVAITGTATPCANQSGVAYSVAPVANATKYTWTAPSGSHINDGTVTSSGGSLTTTSNSVTINFGSIAGSVTCKAGNACGFSNIKSLAVTFGCRQSGFSDNEGSSLFINPNPAKDKAQVTFIAKKAGSAVMHLNDVIGKEVFQKDIRLMEGSNNFEVDFSKVKTGVYLLSVDQNGVKSAVRMVVN